MSSAERLPDWGVGPASSPVSGKVRLALLLIGPVLLLAIGFALLGHGWDLGMLALTVGWFGFLIANQWRATNKASLRRVSARALDDVRFENVVHGLATRYGMRVPELFVIEDGGPNALVLARPKPRIAVTRSLLDTFTRTEQEAVAAHCLLRASTGQLGLFHLAASLGRSASRFAPRVGFEDDVQAAALTRYPPALASAIAKAKPAEGLDGPFWFVSHDPSHRHPSERIAALRDL